MVLQLFQLFPTCASAGETLTNPTMATVNMKVSRATDFFTRASTLAGKLACFLLFKAPYHTVELIARITVEC